MQNKNFQNIIELMKISSFLNIIVFINIGVYLVCLILNLILTYLNLNKLDYIFGLDSNLLHFVLKPWSILTYSFFHHGFLHLFFNMLILNFSGKMFLTYFTQKNLSSLYFLGIIISGIFFLIGSNILPFFLGKNILLLGSSSAVYTIFWSWIFRSPNDYVKLFFTTYLKVWHLGLAILLLSLVSLDKSNNYGGFLSHLGGIFTAWIFVYYIKKGIDVTKNISVFFENIISFFKSTRKEKIFNLKDDLQFNKNKKEKQNEVDIILEKIAKNGYESLTKKEKETLFKSKQE